MDCVQKLELLTEKSGSTSRQVSYTDVSISLSVMQNFDSYSRVAVTSLRGTVGEKTLRLESAGDSTGEDRPNSESRDESDDDTE